MKRRATIVSVQPCDAATAAAIGLPFGKDVFLVYVTDTVGQRWTLVSEADFARMMVEASQGGTFNLDATESTPIPLQRLGWPKNWQVMDDASAWSAWVPEA